MHVSGRRWIPLLFLPFVAWHPDTLSGAAGGRISGWTIADDGQPLAGVEVVLACPPLPVRRILSDERGNFALTDLPAGNCRLRGTKRGYVDAIAEGDPGARGSYPMRMVENQARDGIELRLMRGVILSGRVSTAQGPAKKARVHPILRRMIGGVEKLETQPYAVVDANGAFTFNGLPPGEYYFAASGAANGGEAGGATSFAFTYFPGTTAIEQAATFTLRAGETKQADLTLVAVPGYRVSGAVHDLTGKPLANVDVGIGDDGKLGWIRATTRTADDGTFVLTGVPRGRYVLKAWREPREEGALPLDVVDADIANLIARVGPRR